MKQEDKTCFPHFSFNFDAKDVANRFKDVRFVLIAGCANRVEAQAIYLGRKLFNGVELEQRSWSRLTSSGSRFTLFKIGPVLICDHGIGAPSMLIAVHELVLMCRQAGVEGLITILRFGTCKYRSFRGVSLRAPKFNEHSYPKLRKLGGGMGVAPGTICISTRTIDPLFREFVELRICGNLVRRDSVVNQKLARELDKLAREEPNKQELGDYRVILGTTMSSNDFYEESARTNGAICDHNDDDKMNFLRKAKELGVINTEMESVSLVATCHKLNIPCGVICVVVTDRLVDDTVRLSSSQASLFEQRLFWINSLFIKHRLSVA